MREHKFRGKDDSGQWHYGSLITMYDNDGELCYFIFEGRKSELQNIEPWDDFILVKPETVGEFSELTDNDKNEIYEDDIVEWQQYSFTGQKTETIKGVVYFDTDCGAYGLRTDLVEDFFWLRIFYNEVDLGDITVIGNIHDNKELLKKEDI